MQSLLMALYQELGVDLNEFMDEDPVLYIDSDVQVYFNESIDGLQMFCPLAKLPEEVWRLHECLRMNLTNPVHFASDAENSLLLAVYQLPKESSSDMLIEGLESLVNAAKQYLSESEANRL